MSDEELDDWDDSGEDDEPDGSDEYDELVDEDTHE